MIEGVKSEKAKKVPTYDLEKRDNGFLTELFKEGDKTIMYLSTLKVDAFKGYHLHRIRNAHYICVKGKVKIILYKDGNREEHILDSDNPSRLFVPNNVATGLQNIGKDEAWLINHPSPPYDPNLKDEQIEYTEKELKQGIVK